MLSSLLCFDLFSVEFHGCFCAIQVPDNVVESAARLWSCGQRPSKDMVTEAEMKIGLEHEQRRSDTNLKQYYEIVETLVNLVEGGTL